MPEIHINSSLNERVYAFAKAGTLLSAYLEKSSGTAQLSSEDVVIETAIQRAETHNSWFTHEQTRHALAQWAVALDEQKLNAWLAPYHMENITPRTVGIVAAGNIPLVGFHDVLSIILAGHHALIKLSSNDRYLLPMMLELATLQLPSLADSYTFTENRLKNQDAVIATGSNNTARYFEYYFRDVPHIIRKNRNSIAILTGKETLEDMQALSEDVFRYFGLGCRSVSHLKVRRGYNFDLFFNGMYEQRELINNKKYLNNYDYNKAVYLMSEFDLLDNEFLLIKEENSSYSSPIATLGYSYYDGLDQVKQEIQQNAENLQCVVSSPEVNKQIGATQDLQTPQFVGFGETQQPALSDYADGVDTLQFLISLS